jgi:hypothetical protein
MEAATRTTPESLTAATASTPIMDRDFIARNQIVERYLSGRLPLKGAADFERFCREHPEALDELGLPERVNKALRLLDVSGKPEPWEEPNQFWRKPQVPVVLAALTFVLVVALAIVGAQSSGKSGRIAALEQRATDQPLEPATSTRTIRLLPSRKRATSSPAVVIGGGSAQLADLKIDMAHSSSTAFRITVDRVDQGRVAVLHNMLKDSNGHVRLALNSSALGPGSYRLTIEGLNWQGRAVPEAWITIGIAR